MYQLSGELLFWRSQHQEERLRRLAQIDIGVKITAPVEETVFEEGRTRVTNTLGRNQAWTPPETDTFRLNYVNDL